MTRHPRGFGRFSRGRGLSVLLSSKIAVALTLLVLVMSIGITGFMVFTTHRTGMVQTNLHARLAQLDQVESPTSAQLSEMAGLEMELAEDTFLGELLLSGYMTAITITTVGFDDVVRDYAYEYMDEGWRRAYNLWVTLFVILAYLVIIYVNANFVAYLVGTRLAEAVKRRSLLKRIRKLSGHYIVCGTDGAGSVVIREILRAGSPVVGVDPAEEPPPELMKRRGFFFLREESPDEDALNDAGIARAAGLVTVMPEASQNLYTTLTARLLNPHIRIISRAIGSENEEKLALVGADSSFNPAVTVGRNLVSEMISTETVDFLEKLISDATHSCRMEEYTVEGGSPSVGATLGELDIGRRSGVRIFAIMGKDDTTICNPGADYLIKAGDVLLTIDSPQNLIRLARVMERGRRNRWRK